MIAIEEIDNSSQEASLPSATIIVATKKRTKNKKKSPAVAPPSTLTRFLGPAGPPSLSAWEDVNRQCPVCQQAGFSSRSLALHVNDCLDVRRSARDAATRSDAKGEAQDETAPDVARGLGNASGCHTPKAASARGAGKVGSSNKAGGPTSRGSHAGTIPREVPSNTTGPDCTEVQRLRPGETAKKAKTQQDRREIRAERSVPAISKVAISTNRGYVNDDSRSGAKPVHPRLPHSPQSFHAGVTQRPIPPRRRGLGLARPRGHQTGSDSTPTPAAAAAAEKKVRKGSDEHNLDNIARAQLLYALEASAAGGAPKSGGWLGTRLFPKPVVEDSEVDDRRIDCRRSSTNVDRGALRPDYRRVAANENRRVRGRPASWGARPSGKRRGWLGIWSDGVDGEDGSNDDNCWGDGDGHLTLRPFPPSAESGAAGMSDGGAVARSDDAESLRSNEEGNPAPSSRADIFLQVFSQLQPARRSLNLHVSPPSSPKVNKGTRAGVDRPGERLAPRVDAKDASENIVILASKNQAETVRAGDSMTTRLVVDVKEGGTAPRARAGATANSCKGGIVSEVTTSVPKRAVLDTLFLAEASADDNLRPSTKTAPGRPSVGDAECENRRHDALSSPRSSSTGPPCSLEPVSGRKFGRKEPSAVSQHSRRQTAQQRQEESRRHEGRGHTGTGGPDKVSCSAAPAVRSTSGVKDSSGVDCVIIDTVASSRNYSRVITSSVQDTKLPKVDAADAASISAGSGRATTAPGPVTSQSPEVAIPVEKRATGKRRNFPAPFEGAQLKAVCEAPEPAPRLVSLARSGDMTGRVAGASITSKPPPAARENCQGAPITNEGGNKSKGDPQLGKRNAAPFSSQRSGSRSRGALGYRASSGLLRSADFAAESGNQQTGKEEVKVTPAASDGPVEPVEPAASGTSIQELCQGHEMDVPQNGSLTVVWDHGATLRSSWSIDDSQELGRLMFGASLDYDAVWHLSPADADCVGVVRYHIVPHPTLAPAGGWISERGRLRDDPYTIVKATPAPAPPNRKAIPLLASNRRLAGEEAVSGQGSPPSRGHQRQGNPVNEGLAKHVRAPGRSEHTLSSFGDGDGVQSHVTPSKRKQHVGHCEPMGRHGDHSSACTAAESSRQTQPQPRPASKVGPRAVSSRGSFGLATSPCAKVLEAHDTGDKVTCPVCHKGMDHWKSGQRQQHVHTCLLKQPSSAKKTSFPADVTLTATRVHGNANRSVGRCLSAGVGESGLSSTPRGSLGPGQSGTGASGMEETGSSPGETLPDSTESPRSTRVSLQGVFSPKAANEAHRAGHGPRQPVNHYGGPSSRGSPPASTTAPQKRDTTHVRTSGTGIRIATQTNGSLASRGAAHVGGPTNKVTAASNGLAECPVCRLQFGGRQGQWERQAHIQQCLDSLEGVFDSEE